MMPWRLLDQPTARGRMKAVTVALLAIAALHGAACHAAEPPGSVWLIPSLDWAYQEAKSAACGRPSSFAFSTAELGRAPGFRAVASLCGEVDPAQLLGLFRMVGLLKATADFDGAWKLAVTGSRHIVLIELSTAKPTEPCDIHFQYPTHWVLARVKGAWAVLGQPLVKRHVLCLSNHSDHQRRSRSASSRR